MADIRKQVKNRYRVFAGILVVFLIAVAVQLVNLQVTQGEEYAQKADASKSRTIALTASRGSIMDVNGVVLAYDQESYHVTFYCEPTSTAPSARKAYTQSILNAIEIIEASGSKVIDDFAVVLDAQGNWALDFGTDSDTVFAARESRWRQNFYVTNLTTYPVDQLFQALSQRYQLPEELDYELAHKVLSVWQAMQMNAFLGQPVTIASDVPFDVVAKISARAADNPGIDINVANKRVYPMDTVAAHIIGYTGKMQSEADVAAYKELGYGSDSSIGITGVESTMEQVLSQYLTERQGYQVVERNSSGQVIRVTDYEAPQNGNNVVLTIDLELQQVVEASLAKRIPEIKENQLAMYEEGKETYDPLIEARGGTDLMLAETGAAVVMNVNTGDVLAMASYPSYSLNLFSGGISTADYQTLANDAASPLFNKAVSSRETPGSIYKMATALAGLQEGAITETDQINDGGRYDKYDPVNGPRCWTKYPSQHQHQTVKEAIQNSCNYFFYEVADRLGIEKLHNWSDALGLTTKTGIQITGEATSVVGDPKTLYDSSKTLREQALPAKINSISASIRARLVKVGEDLGRVYEDERLDRVVKQLMDLVDQYTYTEAVEPIREILINEMGLTTNDISSRYLVNQISEDLSNLRWTPTRTIMTGIGQEVTQVSPIAVARYVSAVANGGTVYNANVIDRILDENGSVVSVQEPSIYNQLEGVDRSLELIREGMYGVTDQEAGGTASKYFKNYAYTKQIGAKTGTAQISKIDLENHAWFVVFAPFDDPEIALVVFIPNGNSGSNLSYIVQDIITYYMEKKDAQVDDGVYTPGQLVP